MTSLEDQLADLLQEFVDDAGYTDIGDKGSALRLFKCSQCETSKGAQHSPSCVVGRAEALLRHMEA